jgi:uncharacterized membrane protein
MVESLIGLAAIVGLIIAVLRQQSRLSLIERELGALRSFVLSNAPAVAPAASPVEASEREAAPIGATIPKAADAAAAQAAKSPEKAESLLETGVAADDAKEAAAEGPWAAEGDHGAATTAPKGKPDIESRLGTRWAVWVGGLALALGGIFLVRYSIEAGIFGPGVRLTMAGLLGLLLIAGGEFIRRTGFKMPVEGVQSAYVPGILTAAGAFTLFGALYAAHGIYGFIEPGPSFVLMAVIGLATIAASLVHGQALAGLGLLGSFATPVLVASNAPNPWALFGFLAVILAATGFVARWRDWPLLMGAAFAGAGVWCLAYLGVVEAADLTAVAFIQAVTLAVLGFVWLRGDAAKSDTADLSAGVDKPSIVPAVLVGLAAISLGIHPLHSVAGGTWLSAALPIAMVLVAFHNYGAIALLYGAGVATLLTYVWSAFGGNFHIEIWSGGAYVDGLPVSAASANFVPLGIAIGTVFLVAGLWMARKFAGTSRYRAASWSCSPPRGSRSATSIATRAMRWRRWLPRFCWSPAGSGSRGRKTRRWGAISPFRFCSPAPVSPWC